MSHYQPIQIVNENDEPIGQASMDEVYSKGLIHRIVWVFAEDVEGKILLQKRGPNVATNPNTWDFSAAGHVDAGEDYLTAASRELSEEVGLQGFELEEIEYFRQNQAFGDYKLDRFIKLFKTFVPVGTSTAINYDEVSEVCWLEISAVKQMIKDHKDQLTKDFIKYFTKYY